jgi:hypothetical protein
LSKVISAFGRFSVTPLLKGGDMSIAAEAMFSTEPLGFHRSWANPGDVGDAGALTDGYHLAGVGIGHERQIALTARIGRLDGTRHLEIRNSANCDMEPGFGDRETSTQQCATYTQAANTDRYEAAFLCCRFFTPPMGGR